MSESSERSEELDVDRVEDCCNLDPEEIEADDVESEDSDDNDSDGAENDDEETGDPLDAVSYTHLTLPTICSV